MSSLLSVSFSSSSRRSMAAWKDSTASIVTATVSTRAAGSAKNTGRSSTSVSIGGWMPLTSSTEKTPQPREQNRQMWPLRLKGLSL